MSADRHREANPVTPDDLAALPLDDARRDLWEDIMAGTQKAPGPEHAARRWLIPAAVAAAVVLIAGGVWALGQGGSPSRPTAAASSSAAPTKTTSASPKPPTEHYAMPGRPLLLTAPGWKPDVVDGADVTWSGPGSATITLHWFFYTGNEDPFAMTTARHHHLPGRGQEISVLDEHTRLTHYTDHGVRHQLAIPAPVIDRDGTGVEFDATGLSPARFQQVLASARWVTLRQYDKVIKPAVG